MKEGGIEYTIREEEEEEEKSVFLMCVCVCVCVYKGLLQQINKCTGSRGGEGSNTEFGQSQVGVRVLQKRSKETHVINKHHIDSSTF